MISSNPIGQAAGETVREIISGDMPRHPGKRRGGGGHGHLSDTERNLSIAAGAAVGLIGLVKASGLLRLASLGLAGMLIQRGVAGYCAVYDKLGMDSPRQS